MARVIQIPPLTSLKGRETPGGATRSVLDRGGHRSPNPERAMKLAGAVGRSSDRTAGRTTEHLVVVETTRRGWRTTCRRYVGRSAPGSSSTLRGSSRGWRHPRGTVAVRPKPLEGPRRTCLRKWKTAFNRVPSEVSRIIPGDWGKVGSGWWARPLSRRVARRAGGGRIHRLLWHVRACQSCELGAWR
jgi:hypothetical protein